MFHKKILCLRVMGVIFPALLVPALALAGEEAKKLHEFAQRMPKAELHIHLEGAIAPKTIIDIARENHVDVPFKNEEEFRKMCTFPDFGAFVTVYRIIQNTLKKPADFKRIAYEYGKEAKRQNICYSEVMVSFDSDCKYSGLQWQTIVEALNDGRKMAQKEFGISWNWVLAYANHEETLSPEQFVDIMKEIRLQKKSGLVAIAMLEPLFEKPLPENYRRAFDKAIRAQLPIVPHTGEFKGPLNIAQALIACVAKRLDHGVQCINDQGLKVYLAEKKIPLNVCVTSNVDLHAFEDYAHHPVRKLFDAGVRVTINTDDPSLFGTDLNKEYGHLIDDYHFTSHELENVSKNGVDASMLSGKQKKKLTQTFKKECDLLRKELHLK